MNADELDTEIKQIVAAAMAKARRDALEEAARVCDAYAAQRMEAGELDVGDPEYEGRCSVYAHHVRRAAERIRALI
jgi:hypothetical protein